MKNTGIVRNLGISAKVVAVGLAITGLFVVTTFTWIIPGAERAILERKREKIKEATETAWSVMLYYQSLVDAGELHLEEAQRRAVAVIKNMRYGPEMKDYFWINDMRPYMIMHPYRSDLDGNSLEDFKDPNGVALFVEAAKTCRQQGAGFVSYSWQWKDDKNNIVPKISYVRLYRPWQWIVGTGMYIEDVRAEIRGWRLRVIFVSALVAFFGVILSWRIGQEVAKRIRLLSMGDSDLLKGTGKVWHLHSIVMLIIVPAIACMTVFWCIRFYQSLSQVIIDGFDRKLGAIASTTGCFIRGEDHEAIFESADENTPLYRKYSLPMQHIREKSGLTYLYTQKLIGENPYCKYVLDASLGDDHSEIGYKDELPLTDYQGAENVLLYGVIHKGNVEATEGWGLVKVCYAPIYNDDNSITCMAGADVNISTINVKTRTALFAVGLLAVCAIFGTGYITFLFSKRFGGPISELRDAALMIAGGSHEHHVDVKEPKELIRVSTAFNRIAGRLKETLSELKAADKDIVEGSIQHDLMLALDKPWTNATDKPNTAWLNKNAFEKTTSGWVNNQQNTITWIGNPLPPLDALRHRCKTATVMAKLTVDTSGSACCANIGNASQGLVRACFVVGTIGARAVVFNPVKVIGLAIDGSLSILTLDRNTDLSDLDVQWLIVTDAPAEIEQQAGQALTNCITKGSASAYDLLCIVENNLKTDKVTKQTLVSVLEVQP